MIRNLQAMRLRKIYKKKSKDCNCFFCVSYYDIDMIIGFWIPFNSLACSVALNVVNEVLCLSVLSWS